MSEHSLLVPNDEARGRSPKRRVLNIAAFPALLTLGNAVSGFAALLMLAKAYAFLQLGESHAADATDALFLAAVYISLGAVLDMVDGKVARLTGTEGDFGKELDSLCDAITFGVTPAIFLRVFGEAIYESGIGQAPAPMIRLLWFVSALYLVCAIIRLARFNVETAEDDDHTSFRGLPTPAAAGACLSLFLLCWYFRDAETGALGLMEVMVGILPVAGLALAVLMVSRVRYVHVFNRLISGRRSMRYFVAVLVAVGAIWVLAGPSWELIVSGAMLVYVVSGPLRTLLLVLRNRSRFGRRLKVSQRRKGIGSNDV